MKYPDQCKCGGYFSHSSVCPKYKKPSKPERSKETEPVMSKTIKPVDALRVLAWLGYWRDKMPNEAVSSLQDILDVPQ